MKKLLVLVLCACLCVGLGGCSLFSSGEKDVSKMPDLKITDEVTHVAPEGVSARYAMHSGADEDTKSYYADYYGVDFIDSITIIYGNADNEPVAMSEYIILGSKEDCEKFNTENFTDGFESPYVIVGNTLVYDYTPEDVSNLIEANAYYADFEKTASGFAEWWKTEMFMMDFNGN